MTFPKLFELALEKVVEAINAGTLTPTTIMTPEISNRVLHCLYPVHSKIDEQFLETTAKTLAASEIDLTGSLMLEDVITFLKSQNLTSLSFGSFCLEKYERDDSSRADAAKYMEDDSEDVMTLSMPAHEIHYIYDLGAMLEDMLNDESRQKLVQLNLSPEPKGREFGDFKDQFADGWALTIGEMLPNLVELSFRNRIIAPKEFDHLCANLPNLELLDLTHTGLETLTGISQLKKLKTLRIGWLKLNSSRNMYDLFLLEGLRNLSFECSTESCDECCEGGNTIRMYLTSRRRLPNLEHIDFSWAELNDKMIRRFVEAHPTLKSISICQKFGRLQTEYPGIEVYHTRTVKGATKALEYYTTQKNVWMVDAVMEKLEDLTRSRNRVNFEDVDLMECVPVVNDTLEVYSHVDRVKQEGCYVLRNVFDSMPVTNVAASERVRIINQALADIKKCTLYLDEYPSEVRNMSDAWNLLKIPSMIIGTPHISIDRICGSVLKILEITDQGAGYSRDHVLVLDTLKERIDVSAQVYEGIDMSKVKENLKEIRAKNEQRVNKVAAGRVLKFVQDTF